MQLYSIKCPVLYEDDGSGGWCAGKVIFGTIFWNNVEKTRTLHLKVNLWALIRSRDGKVAYGWVILHRNDTWWWPCKWSCDSLPWYCHSRLPDLGLGNDSLTFVGCKCEGIPGWKMTIFVSVQSFIPFNLSPSLTKPAEDSGHTMLRLQKKNIWLLSSWCLK